MGVSQGFVRRLQIEGVGYRAELQGENLVLNVGYSHPVIIEPPDGISFEVEKGYRSLSVLGTDKELVGEMAARIRRVRPPEPYKGKGIRYEGEYVRRKAGKAGKVQ
jgi:large subunit ribosomal protein L6